MLAREPCDVDLQWDGPDRGAEIEEANLPYAEPVGQVLGIGQGRGQAYDAKGLASVAGDEVGSGDDDFQHWASVLAWGGGGEVKLGFFLYFLFFYFPSLCISYSITCNLFSPLVFFLLHSFCISCNSLGVEGHNIRNVKTICVG